MNFRNIIIMKKSILKFALLGFLSMEGNVGVMAQVNLGDILGAVTGNKSSGSSGNDLISNLTSIFSSNKQATKNQIVGTWEYTEPAIVFESDNFLAKAGASLAAKKIENKIQEHLTRFGMVPGAVSITFNEDGTFTEVLKNKNVKGKWELEDSKLILPYGTIKPVSITTQVEGKTLMIVTDTSQLLNMFKTLGSRSTNSSIKTVTSLMGSVKGMKAGLTLVKK